MDWKIHAAHVFAAVFLVNGIPHFFQGICGNRFQSPFARPPGIGESSPLVNVLWGAFNFGLGGFLLTGFGRPDPRHPALVWGHSIGLLVCNERYIR